MVNEVIEELLNLDMEPKPESVWWTSSFQEEDKFTLQVGGGGKDWDFAVQGGLRGTGVPFST